MKKPRCDSIDVKNSIIESATREIRPPAHLKLRTKDEEYWKVIINARYEWTDIDLVHAYNLARLMSDIQDLNMLIEQEGYTTNGAAGGLVVHPNVTAREKLMNRATSLSSKIQVHAAATVGDAEDNKKKNKAKQNAIKGFQEMEDDLIARPSFQ